MEKSKKTYFKSLFKTVDVFLAVFIGLVFACALYYIDHKNLVGRFSKTLVTYFLPVLKSGLIVGIAGLFLFLIPSLKKSKIQKADAVLFGIFASSLGGLISFKYNHCSDLMIGLWIVTLILSVIFILARIYLYHVSGEDAKEENAVSTKAYFALLAREYNQVIIYGLGAVLGICTLVFVDLTDFFKNDMVLYLLGAVVCLSALTIAYSVLLGKKSKVCIIDAILSFFLGYSLFVGGFLISNRTIRFDLLWAICFASVLCAMIIRSLFVSTNVNVNIDRKGPRNYYGLLFEKYGFTMPVSLGLFIGFLMDLCGNLGLAKTFDRKMTTYFAILIILGLSVAIIMGIVGLCKKGLTSKKVNVLDFVVLSAVVGSSVASLLLIQYITTFRLCLVLIPGAISLILTIVRMFLVDIVNIEPKVDDEIVLKLKVIIDDDKVHAYCNNQEIAVVDNRKKEEVSEVKENPVDAEINEQIIPEETNAETVIERNRLKIAKRSFANKIKFTSDKTKNYYSILKNELLSYRTKSKISKKSESFRKKGLFAKISVSGKSLRIHLALDPNAFDENKYHQINLGERKEFKDVPFTMKIRSDLACRRAVELIQEVANARSLRRNAKYEQVNFSENLDIDGIAILEKVGELKKYAPVVSKQEAEQLTDDVLKFIPIIKMPKALNDESINVYVDTALKYVEDVISADTLHDAQQIPSKVEIINVKSRTGLDKKITVIADDIDPTTAKLVIMTGGKVFKIER